MPKAKLRPLWRGPHADGVTQSLLGRYLCCKERFRLLVIDGLRAREGFLHRLEYGNMWHTCEEALALGDDWEERLREYAQKLVNRFPTSGKQIEKWYQVCRTQFPVYVDYWSEHPDVLERESISAEEVFEYPYELPSGRCVILRGKFDSVDQIRDEVYLQENKTLYDIDKSKITRNLTFDLQTMFYQVALAIMYNRVAGVRYNVIRRPLSGGKYSIRPHQARVYKTKPNVPAETLAEFYDRLEGLIENDPEFFFARWTVDVTKADRVRFQTETLNPILENLLDDYEWWEYCHQHETSPYDYETRGRAFPEHLPRHYRYPYGIFNPIQEGIATDLDEYLETGSKIGLERPSTLFPELEE